MYEDTSNAMSERCNKKAKLDHSLSVWALKTTSHFDIRGVSCANVSVELFREKAGAEEATKDAIRFWFVAGLGQLFECSKLVKSFEKGSQETLDKMKILEEILDECTDKGVNKDIKTFVEKELNDSEIKSIFDDIVNVGKFVKRLTTFEIVNKEVN